MNLGKRMGIIDKIKRKNVRVGRQYSSAGYNPNSNCFHLAVKTEKQATLGSKSRHSLNDFVCQCPPQAHGKNSAASVNKKYKQNKVRKLFHQPENKFCLIQPTAPTSVIGGGEGNISFFLTNAILDTYLPTYDLERSIEIIDHRRNQ